MSEGAGRIDTSEVFSNAFIGLTKSEAGNFTWIWNLLYSTAVVNAVDPQLIDQLRVLHYGQQRDRVKKYPGRYPVLQELRRLINVHFREGPDALWYAEILQVPLWKLNAWCRESLGSKINGLLTERVMLEAEALLVTTD